MSKGTGWNTGSSRVFWGFSATVTWRASGRLSNRIPIFRSSPVRNEQAAVHLASGFAKTNNRLRTFACTSSIGPGATNMITGAALATINRLPVLLLPGDIFARRNVAPVLQQLESPTTEDIGVNDCFKPVSRYWDRIYRPEQLITALPQVMRVLTSPSDCGAVTLSLPQDVQAEAWDYPEELFRKRIWLIRRPEPDEVSFTRAVAAIGASRKPFLVAGGGVLFSEASGGLAKFCASTGIPVGETQAGKGSLPYDHPQCMGAVGATGTLAANRLAREADLVIGVGTRYGDFTTASMTAFQNPNVRFVNINTAEFDAFKVAAIPVVADARLTLERLTTVLSGCRVDDRYAAVICGLKHEWEAEVDRLFHLGLEPRPAQSEVIGAMWEASGPRDILLSAAGSHPGDLHKLWRTRAPNGYHMEYGYSCMGYEIPGAIGAKMADPTREVYVFLGDGTYLMMPGDIVTSVQEGVKIIIVLVDNHGFASIGGLSQSLGQQGFGTVYRSRVAGSGRLEGEFLPVDYEANARSLGAYAIRANGLAEFKLALEKAKSLDRTTVIVIETEREVRVPGYESWWDVAVAEVSEMESVQESRARYVVERRKERYPL